MAILIRQTERNRSDKYLEFDRSASDRERLLRASCEAGLEPNVVVDLSEALTGRPWGCIGRTEIRLVARALLQAADRVACRPNDGARPCAE